MNAPRDEIHSDMSLPLSAGIDDDGTRVWLERDPRTVGGDQEDNMMELDYKCTSHLRDYD